MPRNASVKEIRRAYRRLARQFHPDRNPGDRTAEERFKQINEAHEVLTDPDKRHRYDRLGTRWQHWQRTGRHPGNSGFDQWFAGGPGHGHFDLGGSDASFRQTGRFADFFHSVFGEPEAQPTMQWQRAQRRVQRGQDQEVPVEITLDEAFCGTHRVVKVDGSQLKVKIPPGVETGSRVRVAGKGGHGKGGAPAGDLYLAINVLSHELFERRGDDLYCQIPVELYIAMLGGEVPVATLAGTVHLQIPPETQNGCSFRLRGRGMPHPGDPGQYGELLAKVQVVLPEHPGEREKELFRELARLGSGSDDRKS